MLSNGSFNAHEFLLAKIRGIQLRPEVLASCGTTLFTDALLESETVDWRSRYVKSTSNY